MMPLRRENGRRYASKDALFSADFFMEDVRQKVDSVEGVNSSVINLVFEPEWDKDMMSEEAKLELGFL